MRVIVGPTGPELDIGPELLHDLGSLHAHKNGATVRAHEVLHPGGAGRAGVVGRCLLDAFSKSSSHVDLLRVDVGVGVGGLVRVSAGHRLLNIPWFWHKAN